MPKKKRTKSADTSSVIVAAIEGSLKATDRPVCTSCTRGGKIPLVNLKRDPQPCISCGSSTTWRAATC